MLSVLRLRGVGYLLVTSLVGRLPSGMALVALVRLVLDQGGSYATASLLTAVYVLAGTVGQPVLSRVIDRTGRARAVLLGSALVATGALVALAYVAVSTPLAGLALSGLAGFAAPPLEACLRALWSRIMTPGDQLHQALSLDAAAQEIMFVSAPLISALGIATLGAQGNVLFMAALGMAGTVAFSAHGLLADREVPPTPHEGHGSPMRAAWFRHLTLVLLGAGASVGVLLITSAAFGERVGRPSFGAWALALNAAGSFTGAILIAHFPLRIPTHRAIPLLAAAMSALYLPTAWSTAPSWLWLFFAYLSGICLPPLLTQVFSHLAHSSPAHQLNEANAWVLSAFTVGISAGSLAAGFAIDATSTVATGITLAVVLGSALGLVAAAATPASTLRPAA